MKFNIKSRQDALRELNRFRDSSLQLNQWCAKIGTTTGTFRKHIRKYFKREYDEVVASKKPKSSQYKLGRAFEYSVRDKFKSKGYLVIRSAQSKGIADLVALRDGNAILIQCKRGGAISGEEWDTFYNEAMRVGAVPIIAERPTGRGVRLYCLESNKSENKRRPFDP